MSTEVGDLAGSTVARAQGSNVEPPPERASRRAVLLRYLPLVVVCATLAVVVSRALQQLWDYDLWWHLRLGNDLIAQRSLSAPDWGPLATQTWTPTEPLLEIVAAGLVRAFGLGAVKWLFGIGLAGLVVAAYTSARRIASPWASSLVTIAVMVGCSISLTPRPQLVSFALIAVVINAWFATEKDAHPRWWLIPVTWLWSLVHGLWIVGVAYGTLFVVAGVLSRRWTMRQLLRMVLVPVLSMASVLLNPAGLGVIEAPFTIPGYGHWVAEWGHTQPVGTAAAIAVEVMILEVVGLWILNRKRIPWSRVLLLLTAVFWLYYAYRTVAIAAIVTGPLLAEAIDTMVREVSGRPARPSGIGRPERALLAGWAVTVLVVLAAVVPQTSMQPKYVPTNLDPVLDRLPAGTIVLGNYGIGGWLTWRHPDLHPVIDGLATPYSVAYFDAFHAALDTSRGWQEFVQRTGARATLLSDVFPLVGALEKDGWVEVGQENGYHVLVRPDLARQLGYSRAPSSSGSRGSRDMVATR